MMKRRFVCILMCALLLLSCTAVAEQTAIAPEVVPGRIMGYVINNEGAEVYEDIYSAEATMEPVKTYEYGTEIEIQKLGLGYCRVRSDDNKVLFVRTRDLSFSNEPFGSQLAIVFVKRSKVLPLHKTDSAKSKRVTDVPDGSYVVVLEKGATFSHVLYGKYDGYLQNAYLSFREAWPDDVQQAILRNPDQPKRHMTINLRSADSLNGKKVTTLPTYNKKTKSNTILTVLQIKDNERSRIILQAVISMADSLGMYVITEGIETEQQLNALTEMGCNYFQGYYFSRPIPVEEFEKKYT